MYMYWLGRERTVPSGKWVKTYTGHNWALCNIKVQCTINWKIRIYCISVLHIFLDRNVICDIYSQGRCFLVVHCSNSTMHVNFQGFRQSTCTRQPQLLCTQVTMHMYLQCNYSEHETYTSPSSCCNLNSVAFHFVFRIVKNPIIKYV